MPEQQEQQLLITLPRRAELSVDPESYHVAFLAGCYKSLFYYRAFAYAELPHVTPPERMWDVPAADTNKFVEILVSVDFQKCTFVENIGGDLEIYEPLAGSFAEHRADISRGQHGNVANNKLLWRFLHRREVIARKAGNPDPVAEFAAARQYCRAMLANEITKCLPTWQVPTAARIPHFGDNFADAIMDCLAPLAADDADEIISFADSEGYTTANALLADYYRIVARMRHIGEPLRAEMTTAEFIEEYYFKEFPERRPVLTVMINPDGEELSASWAATNIPPDQTPLIRWYVAATESADDSGELVGEGAVLPRPAGHSGGYFYATISGLYDKAGMEMTGVSERVIIVY